MSKKTLARDFPITLKCFYGFELVLVDELEELGYTKAEVLNRAVRIKGNWKDVYYLNLHCRCAISVLVEIMQFEIKEEKDLYESAMEFDWTSLFSINKTFAIKGAIFSEIYKNTNYPFLLLKDAIVDTFRNKNGERPNIERKKPSVVFDLYVRNRSVTISINTSGLPLFQRGYRQSTGLAPLNEVVAACLIRQSGWDKKTTFVDPFCGSGTLLIEAALYANNIPSNIERRHYAFKSLLNYNEELWNSIYTEVKQGVRNMPCTILGFDISDEMVLKSKRNMRTFSFGRFIKVQAKDFKTIRLNDLGGGLFILTNPPYGERIQVDIETLYHELGKWLKFDIPNSECWIISSSEEGFKNIGLKHDKKLKVFNGDLECSFRKYVLYKS